MKNGTLAGAIGGLVGGILAYLFLITMMGMGIFQGNPAIDPTTWMIQQIGINVIIGAVLGFLYARFYDLIWGVGISKGIVWNMIIYFFADIITALWLAALLLGPLAMSWPITAFIARLTNGIVLGALYKK